MKNPDTNDADKCRIKFILHIGVNTSDNGTHHGGIFNNMIFTIFRRLMNFRDVGVTIRLRRD